MTQTTLSAVPARSTYLLTGGAALGVLFSFLSTVSAFAGVEAAGKSAKLFGADAELGFPASAFAMALFVAVLAVAVARLAGADLHGGVWTAFVPLSLITVVFTLWSLYLRFDWLMLVQVIAAAGIFAIIVRWMPRGLSTPVLGVFLVVGGVVGFFAAFRLTVDKIGLYVNPTATLSCDVSPIVQCGKNLASAQGSLFGFPNPLLGVGGWVAVIFVGILLLSGLSFARWFWIAFNVGVAGALALVIWLVSQSVFVIGTLCPWCMVTWAVTIPTFLLVTLNNGRNGRFGGSESVRRGFSGLYGWVPIITLACYLVVILLAQLRFDLLSYL